MTVLIREYQAAQQHLAVATRNHSLGLWTAHTDGDIEEDLAGDLIAQVINVGIAKAVTLADEWLARQIEHATRQPTPTIGITPKDHFPRLRKAMRTIFRRHREQPDAETNRPDMQIGRTAHSEPLEAGQRATTEAMTKHPLVQGWIREFDADPCQLCTWWARDGRIWPADHPMPTHKGCNCSQRIVVAERIKETSYTRRLHREQALDGTRFPREGEQ